MKFNKTWKDYSKDNNKKAWFGSFLDTILGFALLIGMVVCVYILMGV